jgi:hypothetical protein
MSTAGGGEKNMARPPAASTPAQFLNEAQQEGFCLDVINHYKRR